MGDHRFPTVDRSRHRRLRRWGFGGAGLGPARGVPPITEVDAERHRGLHVEIPLGEGDLDAVPAQGLVDRPAILRPRPERPVNAFDGQPDDQFELQPAFGEVDQPELGNPDAVVLQGKLDLLRRLTHRLAHQFEIAPVGDAGGTWMRA